MYNNIRKYNTDLVAYNSYYIDYLTKASNQRNKKIVETTYDGIYNDNEIEILIKNIIDYKKPREAFFSSACSKLFKKSIIKKNEINFNEDVIIAEDTLFVVEYLFHCNRVFCSNEPHYFYVQHSSSSTSKAITADEKWHSFKNYLNNLTDLFRNSEYSYLTENAQSLSLKSMSTVLKFIFNNSSYNSYIKKRKKAVEILNDKYFRKLIKNINFKDLNRFKKKLYILEKYYLIEIVFGKKLLKKIIRKYL